MLAGNGELVRARLRLPGSARVSTAQVSDGTKTFNGVHIELPLDAGEESSAVIALPFVPRLMPAERAQLAGLDYDVERARVVRYWQGVTAHAVPFNVPERRFDTFARAVICHIRISATKDPKSGLYMVPAASYVYTTKTGEWPSYTGDVRGSKYSPLDQITADNFGKLEIAWRFKTDSLGTRPEYKLEGTPLMVRGVLYATAGTRRAVVAIDAATGEL